MAFGFKHVDCSEDWLPGNAIKDLGVCLFPWNMHENRMTNDGKSYYIKTKI